MAANPRDILIRPIITEKTSVMMQDNKSASPVRPNGWATG